MTRKEQLLHILNTLRLQQCAYSSSEQSAFCDCKFTGGQVLAMAKEEDGNGCPELYCVIRVIEAMHEDLVDGLFVPTSDLDHLEFVRIIRDDE